MTLSLFSESLDDGSLKEDLAAGAVMLPSFALPVETTVLETLGTIIDKSALRHMVTPGGFRMSVAMTSCGALGWVSDQSGFRYDAQDPDTREPRPGMPDCFKELASDAASEAS
jgi:alkylated DNA repair protein (DNA oxidative demethylase)